MNAIYPFFLVLVALLLLPEWWPNGEEATIQPCPREQCIRIMDAAGFAVPDGEHKRLVGVEHYRHLPRGSKEYWNSYCTLLPEKCVY